MLWSVGPDVPAWWPVAERWWLPGGQATGVTQFALRHPRDRLIVWSYRRFHGNPEAIAEVESADSPTTPRGVQGGASAAARRATSAAELVDHLVQGLGDPAARASADAALGRGHDGPGQPSGTLR